MAQGLVFSVVGVEAFLAPTTIDFESAPGSLVSDFYAAQGVTFVNLSGGWSFDTGTGNGPSGVACNFFDAPDFPEGELLFVPAVTRAGFFLTGNERDDVTVTAFSNGEVVGSEFFATGGGGQGGSFVGVQFDASFDRLVITPTRVVDGAFCIDDLRFEAEIVGESETDLEVAIDIRPGSERNPVNPKSRGVIPVGILSAEGFDAVTAVDLSSLTFGATGDELSLHLHGGRGLPNCGVADVNGDALRDVLCHFRTERTGLQAGDTAGVLKGKTTEGVLLQGSDSVSVVGG